jgi:hypothetical protein
VCADDHILDRSTVAAENAITYSKRMSVDTKDQGQLPRLGSSNDLRGHEMKQRGAMLSIALLLMVITALFWAPIASTTQTWQQIQLRYLCVTEGSVKELSPGNLGIEDPRTRAVLGFSSPQTAELFYRYLGPTTEQVPLESGAVRTQIGLKMRAEDACNLVYVMWRIVPVSQIVVSVESNPSLHTSTECLNKGYHNVIPEKSILIPALKIGGAHSLRAELTGTQLSVLADGQLAWEAELDSSAFQFNGPVGFRSDNGQFDAQFFAFQTSTATVACPKNGPE